jgi:hypothetical protein
MTKRTRDDRKSSGRLFVIGGFYLVPSPHSATYEPGSCDTRVLKSPAKLTVVRTRDPHG